MVQEAIGFFPASLIESHINNGFQFSIAFTERKRQLQDSMAIGNVELMQECFPKQ